MINEDFQKGDERGEKNNKGCIQLQEERRRLMGWGQWGKRGGGWGGRSEGRLYIQTDRYIVKQ